MRKTRAQVPRGVRVLLENVLSGLRNGGRRRAHQRYGRTMCGMCGISGGTLFLGRAR